LPAEQATTKRRGARASKPGTATTARQGNTRSADRPKVEVKDEQLEDFNESVNILVYANSGVGKTTLIGSAPNPTWLSTEKGVVSAKRAGHTGRLWRAPTWEHVEVGVERAEKELGPEDWLLVDSVSKMQVLLGRWWLGRQHEENDARDLDIPQIQDYQKFQNMYMRFIDRLVDAPCNVIFTATAMSNEDPEGETLVLPAITGKGYSISNYCCAQMDLVLYYGVARQQDKQADTVRRILAETFPPWFAKDRYSVLDRFTDVYPEEYDTMAWIIEQIMSIAPEERQALKAAS
jgi:hypothetical protein